MKVLVACEESQTVCKAFRARGFEAYSCDIQDCSGGHPEWHIKGDVLPLLNGDISFTTVGGCDVTIKGKWDLIIAHPPCTYLSNAGACRMYKVMDGEQYIRAKRYWKMIEGRAFFVLDIVKRSGVKYDAHYTITSVDPPELIRYIRKYHPDVSMDYPRDKDGKVVTMWNLIPKHTIPPTRQARYCCASIKEVNGKGRVTVTGVRWDESSRRKKLHGVANVKTESKKIINDALMTNPAAKLNDRGNLIMNDDNDESRRIVENCYRTRKVMVNPIVDWTDEEVWEYIHKYNLPYCELYDQGYNRIGCIGCPLAGAEKMKKDFARYPKYRDNYIRAFDRMIKAHPGEIKIATGEPAETGGAYSERGTSGADMVDQPELSRVETGGAERTETSSGGHGRSESTSEERNGYAERNAPLVPTVRKGCKYKMIQNGMDEYKWWIEEAIDAGTVEIMRGEQIVREKAILPTAILCFELWIKQFVEGDSKGLNLVPVQNGKSRQLIRKKEDAE